ncbi:hypothetical protein [Kribbella sp. NPDC055071]
MNEKAADAAIIITPAAVDRGWAKACRCTAAMTNLANAVNSVAAVVVVPAVAQAVGEPRAVMSERPS